MAKKELTGYDLTAKLRKTRRRFPLTAIEQAVYHELAAICNDDDWEEIFTCSNEELCNSLRIAENTLKEARNRLIQAGLLFYQSGKSKRQFSKYSFITPLTTSSVDTNAYTNAEVKPATDSAPNPAPEADTNPADYNKRETKPKPNENNTEDELVFSEKFESVWQDWEQFRKEKKQKLTDSTKVKQRKMLARYDEATAIAMLEQSITNGWTGIFDLKKPLQPTSILPDGTKPYNQNDDLAQKRQAYLLNWQARKAAGLA